MEKVIIEKIGYVVKVIINNPPVNALDDQTVTELGEAFDEIAQYDDARAVVITGAGEKAFVAGADINQFVDMDYDAGIKLVRKGQLVYQKIEELGPPVICAINGFAFGGGLELALACDIRFASKNAKVGLPETTLGVFPGYGGTQRLSRLIGKGQAKRLIFTGEPVTAEEAYNLGIVEVLTEKGEVVEKAMEYAKKVATGSSPMAVRLAKRVINQGNDHGLYESIRNEALVFGEACMTKDKDEGVAAFLEKRKPNFVGE